MNVVVGFRAAYVNVVDAGVTVDNDVIPDIGIVHVDKVITVVAFDDQVTVRSSTNGHIPNDDVIVTSVSNNLEIINIRSCDLIV